MVADIAEQDSQDTARKIEELGGRALAVRCDVTRSEDVKAALDKLINTFGHLDIAFNNAGAVSATAPLRTSRWNAIPVPAVILAKVASDGGCSPCSSRAMSGCFIPTARASSVWVRP